jgi:hypothetical protein
MVKSIEDGSGFSFPSKVLRTSGAKSDPRPRSSHLVSPSPINYHVVRTRDWRVAMHLNKKSDNTIINDRP